MKIHEMVRALLEWADVLVLAYGFVPGLLIAYNRRRERREGTDYLKKSAARDGTRIY